MRRFLIGAVAAAAAFAATSAPAQAQDKICAPEPYSAVCVTGLGDVVPTTQNLVWAKFVETMQPVIDAYIATSSNFNAIPDPLCVTTVSPVCVHGLRDLANTLYFGLAYWVFSPTFGAAECATARPQCPLPKP